MVLLKASLHRRALEVIVQYEYANKRRRNRFYSFKSLCREDLENKFLVSGHMCACSVRSLRKRSEDTKPDSESHVAKAMTMETAQEQDLAFERLRLFGDYQHNCDVLALGEGELTVVQMPKKVEGGIAANFLPCPSCMGFFMASEL